MRAGEHADHYPERVVMTDADQPVESPEKPRTARLPFRRRQAAAPAPDAPARFTLRLSRADDGRLRIDAGGPPGIAEAHSLLPELPIRQTANGHAEPAAADFLRGHRVQPGDRFGAA